MALQEHGVLMQHHRANKKNGSIKAMGTSEDVSGVEMAATGGVATSMTLSAMFASYWSSIAASAEARTIRTLAGSLCRNSS